MRVRLRGGGVAAKSAVAYNREANGVIGNEVIVQSGEVDCSAANEFQRDLRLDGDCILSLDDVQQLLLLLLDLVAQRAQVLDDVGRSVEAGGGRDVVKRGVWRQRRRVRRREELPVGSLQRHGCRTCLLFTSSTKYYSTTGGSRGGKSEVVWIAILLAMCRDGRSLFSFEVCRECVRGKSVEGMEGKKEEKEGSCQSMPRITTQTTTKNRKDCKGGCAHRGRGLTRPLTRTTLSCLPVLALLVSPPLRLLPLGPLSLRLVLLVRDVPHLTTLG